MQARIGDRLIVQGRHVGDRDQVAEVLEVHGSEGAPPYVVRWDDGHTATVFPGADALIRRAPGPKSPKKTT